MKPKLSATLCMVPLLTCQTAIAAEFPQHPVEPSDSVRAQIKAELRKELKEELRRELKEELRKEFLEQARSEGWTSYGTPRAVEEANATARTLVQTLVQSGIISREQAEGVVQQAKRSAADTVTAETAGSKVVRVPYVPLSVRNDIKDELRKEVMAQAKEEGWAAPSLFPSWLSGMRWSGDVRVRWQQDNYSEANFTPLQLGLVQDPITVTNSQDTANRLRLRLRFGVEAKVGDMTELGFRLASGALNNPLSLNQTLGNNFERYTVGIDRAFIKFEPTPWLSILGGRFQNPFLGTDLVWHQDLGFDGVAAKVHHRWSEGRTGFITVGAFPVDQNDPSPTTSAKDKWMLGGQTGFEMNLGQTGIKLGLGLYDYRHLEGVPNTGDFAIDPVAATRNDWTAQSWRQKGNSLVPIQAVNNPTTLYGLASKFRLLNLTGSMDLTHLAPTQLTLTGDYVRNIGFDRAEILSRTGRDLERQNSAYHVRATFGTPLVSRSKEWNVFAAYKYIQRDAVPDAFNDSDFRLGGTDSKGYVIGGNFGIDKNASLQVRWISANPISGPPYAVDVLQVDVNARF